MVLPPLIFMVDSTINVRVGSTILRTLGVPKNYSILRSKLKVIYLSCFG